MCPIDHRWLVSQERQSQFLYVAFCEYASTVLDLCEGESIIRSTSTSSVRQNWAATVLYYSLVHSGRLTVFMGAGDFPTRHHELPRCFDENWNGVVRLDWLSEFLRDDATRFGRQDAEQNRSALFSGLLEQWEGILRNSVSRDSIKEHFSWLRNTLESAKKLRNE